MEAAGGMIWAMRLLDHEGEDEWSAVLANPAKGRSEAPMADPMCLLCEGPAAGPHVEYVLPAASQTVDEWARSGA